MLQGMQALSENRKGEWYIGLEILLWAFFPIVTVLSFSKIPALLSLAWSSLFAFIFFLFIVIYQNKWHEMRSALLWKYILGVTFLNSVAFYALYFTALKYTTPGNAVLISLLEILTSFIFFNVILGEKTSREHIVGACFMLVGAFIVLAPNFSGINVGDFLILGATLAAPLGNLFQQRARKLASGETVIFLRSLLAVPIIFFLAFLFGQHNSLSEVWDSLWFLVINGVLLLGLSKLLWLEGIHRLSVTKAMAMQGAIPFITLIAAWVFLDQLPTMWQVLSLVPLTLGLLLLTDQLRFHFWKESGIF